MILHGIQPGPEFFGKGVLPYAVFAGILLAQFTFFVLGLGFAGKIAKVVLVPNIFLVPAVVVLCFFGAFAARNFLTDVVITLIFGVFGFALYKSKWPLPCLVLGFVLGDILEANFHRTPIIGHGSLMPFVTSPTSLVLFVSCIVLLALLQQFCIAPKQVELCAGARERGRRSGTVSFACDTALIHLTRRAMIR